MATSDLITVLTVTSSSITVENLAHFISRMSLHEAEQNQPSSHMLEIPLAAVAVGKDVGNKAIKEEEKIVVDVASHQKRSR